jgi:redox-sensing transcriptional repressor
MAGAGRNGVSSDETKPRARTVGRLSLYRRLLRDLFAERAVHVYSHQLAEAASTTAAQVRRDLMALGYRGCPQRGYNVEALAGSIDDYLDARECQGVALVGVGNLGKALIRYFAGRGPNMKLAAALDSDPAKVDRAVGGCWVYPVEKLAQVVRRLAISVAILAVPASEAQGVADTCVAAGVRGLLNFAPFPVRVPEGIYVSHADLTMALETVVFFAKRAEAGPLSGDREQARAAVSSERDSC